nr:hypothetical protein GCM10020093_096570 [Planobispora longispora]
MNDRNPYGIDVNTANVARIYDYMLGGKDNFAADRAAAEEILKAFPESREGVRLNREFLGNVVRHLAAEAGVRQFLDIGAGLPTQKNVHEVAHEVNPEARTVYVDNDPVVCVHGRALLASTPTVAMVEGDLRAPRRSGTERRGPACSSRESRSPCSWWRSCTSSTTPTPRSPRSGS